MPCVKGRSTASASASLGTVVAVSVGVGCIALPTTAIWKLSPEKVLGCRLEWAQRHPDRLQALVRSLYKAAVWCEQPENHSELARLLAEPRFVGAPAEILLRGLSNRLCLQRGGEAESLPGFYLPASQEATFPWVSHALWFYSQMVRWGQVAFDPEHVAQVRGDVSARSVSSGAGPNNKYSLRRIPRSMSSSTASASIPTTCLPIYVSSPRPDRCTTFVQLK